nr:uncharacterized protein LOC107790117 [Ipomoea trifida]GMC63995.1 uncharacterized protein LOC107790117 [Ipomoea batatas]
MARITPTDLTLHNLSLLPFSPTVFITILAILAVLSTVVLLCGAHRVLTSTRGNVEQKKKKSVRLGGKKPARLHIISITCCDDRYDDFIYFVFGISCLVDAKPFVVATSLFLTCR